MSFHLGADASTIDLARELTPAEIAAAEDAANRVVWDDRPVTHPVRRRGGGGRAAAAQGIDARPATLRMIDIADFDVSACGGTHVRRTGAIGVIAISGWERFRGGTRLEFMCGGRALRAHRTLRDTVARQQRSAVDRSRRAAPGNRAAAE